MGRARGGGLGGDAQAHRGVARRAAALEVRADGGGRRSRPEPRRVRHRSDRRDQRRRRVENRRQAVPGGTLPRPREHGRGAVGGDRVCRDRRHERVVRGSVRDRFERPRNDRNGFADAAARVRGGRRVLQLRPAQAPGEDARGGAPPRPRVRGEDARRGGEGVRESGREQTAVARELGAAELAGGDQHGPGVAPDKQTHRGGQEPSRRGQEDDSRKKPKQKPKPKRRR